MLICLSPSPQCKGLEIKTMFLSSLSLQYLSLTNQLMNSEANNGKDQTHFGATLIYKMKRFNLLVSKVFTNLKIFSLRRNFFFLGSLLYLLDIDIIRTVPRHMVNTQTILHSTKLTYYRSKSTTFSTKGSIQNNKSVYRLLFSFSQEQNS